MYRMCAKEYAQSRGWPLKTIRRLCKEGILANKQIGRVYFINVDEADKYFQETESDEREEKQGIVKAKKIKLDKSKIKPPKDDFLDKIAQMRKQIREENQLKI